ncbi:triose-phosphate isomerase family protein [Nocardiopsis sp. MG754419]|uniref:triose-phosphate isomerase family protein n=1 Tax=Nocardiopsis sp. MG754419 TaxID=2259865 RepID=UPI001BA5DFD4|nr:triose-phosphate isomerase family protein [Nocardiopsis sp. MG754419]MBR8743361.1 triosephosphate isomerase [Nocardiopsis sp. MG754419]
MSHDFVIGVSLKMYFSHARTLEWCRRVGALAAAHPAIRTGATELVALPTFPALVPSRPLLGPSIALGAQDVAATDAGPHTGEVGGGELAEVGCTFAEIGHAERRRMGETDAIVGEKVSSALRHGLVPLVCVGEAERADPRTAATVVADELRRVLAPSRARGQIGRVVVAYEPHWAIGRSEAAPTEHISTVCRHLRSTLTEDGHPPESRVLYGGSAGPGLLTELGDAVQGLFLGRFAHDPDALTRVLDETLALKEGSS